MIAEILSFFRKINAFIFRIPFLRKIEKSSPSIFLFLVMRLKVPSAWENLCRHFFHALPYSTESSLVLDWRSWIQMYLVLHLANSSTIKPLTLYYLNAAKINVIDL